MSPASMTGWISNVELPIKDGEQLGRVKKALLDTKNTNVTYYGWAGKFWQRCEPPVPSLPTCGGRPCC